MKRKLRSLLALVLSAGMLLAILPSSMAAGTDVVKDYMNWPNWSAAGYLEGTSYYTGALSGEYNTWSGYTGRSGGNAKHWISDASLADSTAITPKIYRIRGDVNSLTDAPTRGGAFGYVGHNYGKLSAIADKETVPADWWMGVKDISAYKDNGYLVFKVDSTPVNYNNAYFCITAVADQYGMYPFESTGTTLPITKETHGENTTWKDHRVTAINGVKVSDYYAGSGAQVVAIPLKKLVDDPDFQEFGGTYCGDAGAKGNLETLYANPDYKMDLRLYSGAGVAKREAGVGERLEMRLTASEGFKIVALQSPTNLKATVNENKISLSWTGTNDEGVTYRLVKEIDGAKEYIEVGTDTAYVDSVTANGTYTYSVEAFSVTYNVPSPASNSVEAVVAVEGSIDADAESLILEDFTVPTGASNTTERAKPQPMFLGDLYASSSGTISPYRFSAANYYESKSDYQRWYINDTGYGTDKGRAITYRPRKAGEYFVTRDIGGVATDIDAYVPWYAGYVKDGDYGYNNGGDGYVPEEWIQDKWGFNGYRYNYNVVQNGYRDLSEYIDNGYILFNISIPSGMNIDGVYLGVTTTSSSWLAETPAGQTVAGVPLKNYYDTSVGGYQTIMVPFSDFDFTKNGGNNDVLINNMSGWEWVYFNGYDDYRKYNEMHWEYFTGIGLVRQDNDSTKCEEFYADIKNLAVVNDIVKPSTLTAEFIPASECVALEWTESGYTDTTYTLIKNNGGIITEIDLGEDTIYVDREIDDGNYTYAIKTTVGKYALTRTSAEAEVEVTGLGGGDIGGDDVEKTVDPVKFDLDPMTYKSEKDAVAYYKGKSPGYNNFRVTGNYTNDGYQSLISDNNGDATIDNSEINAEISDALSDSPVGTKNWGAANWAFEGFHLNYSWTANDATSISKVPDEHWGNVFDASSYVDTGYAVFEIDLGNTNTTTDGLYLALKGVTDPWAFHYSGGAEPPITKEKYPDMADNTHYASTIAGVNLADYYDVTAGGHQIVAVPLKDFVNTSVFTDMYGKAWGLKQYNENRKLDLRALSGMGIVKQDKDASTVTTADVYMKQLKIMDIQTPQNFKAETKNGVVNLSWDGTTDKDVVYNVVKTVNGIKKYLNAGQKNYYNDVDVEEGVEYSYAIVAVHTGTGARIMSPESDSVIVTSEGSTTVEKVDVVLIDYEANAYTENKSPAAYYHGAGSQYNDYKTSWEWEHNGGYRVTIDDNNGDDTISDTEINGSVQGLASHGSPDGAKNWGSANWGHDGFRLQRYWTNGDAESMAAIPDNQWGNLVDISAGKESAYAIFEVKIGNKNTATEGIYLTVSSVYGPENVYGFDATAGYPVTKENQPNVKDKQHGATAIFGVPLEDYYDFDKGGYQTFMIPITEFSQNAEFVDVFGKSDFGANDYDASAVKFVPEMFDGMGAAKLDTDPDNLTTFDIFLKTLKIVNVAAPKKLTATIDGVNVVLSWPASATNDVSGYEVYKNGELLTTVRTTSYTDTGAGMDANKYSVRAIHSGYGIKSAHTYSGTVKLPTGTVKLYQGTGSSKVETKYVELGDMTVSGYSMEEGNTLYVARYDAEGRLIGAYKEALPLNAWKDVAINVADENEIIKCFIWNTTTYEPASETYMFKKLGIKTYMITYPSFGTKAVTFNINDGADTDAAVIDLMHEYGINATFGLTDATTDYSIYEHEDFEIANHTTHIPMYAEYAFTDENGNTVTPPTYDECVESIEIVETLIEDGTGTAPVGFAWPYFAPEERSIYNQLKLHLATNNYEYMRDSQVTGSYDLPADWKDWGISAWVQKDNTDSILDLANDYKGLNTTLFKVLSIAGNGEDMTEAELLAFYEELFTKLSDEEIWKATNLEVCRYIQATNKLEITKEYIYNPTSETIYMIVNGGEWVAEPNSYAHAIEE
ncbi:MAG: hypothetical protein E7417_01560 [Ruminococcaceae bacterium]|nr:hypothetical protein [Oscillospiraceae bacterium]